MSNFKHIFRADDLVTTRVKVRAGFISMALEKNRRAIPFLEEGRALKAAASKVEKAQYLLTITAIRPALLTAAGLSAKALNHLEESDKTDAIRGLIEQFLEPAGNNFVDELVYRFLLIKGDSLGGAMRNVAGFLAEQLFKRSVISALNVRAIEYSWFSKQSNQWLKGGFPLENTDDVNGIYWKYNRERILVFNKNIPFIKKNIDICLLESKPDNISKDISNPEKYIVLGELKGGIDPAGADEHWKTARTAIERILESFPNKKSSIKTLFIGAAIEKSMSDEIWKWLQIGKLHNAGNLTDKDHVASVCDWLVSV